MNLAGWEFRFRPKLLDALRDYSRPLFLADLIAGLTVGLVALPLALAFGIASGVPPAAGLYTAIVAGFLISALGGSKVQIGGPTGAFVGIVYGVLTQYGPDNLIICTLLAGVMLLGMGLARLGTMIKYIPYPVTTGFTAGIAVIILSTQLKDFFGLHLDAVPARFVPKLQALWAHRDTLHGPTLALATGAFVLVRFWPKPWNRRVPGSILVLVLGTMLTTLFPLGVETIGSRFGDLPQRLPLPHLPALDQVAWAELISPAFTIALLAAIESLLCAVVADGMIEDRHDSNTELLAQGVANIACACVGGIPATGAIARTATNVKCGARTPVAGIIHALTLLGVVLLAAPLARDIPLAVLAAVLLNVSLNMGEWHHFARLRRWPKSDTIVYLVAFTLTVLVDLTVAVEVGLVMASFLFIKRISETTQITAVDERVTDLGPQDSLVGKPVPGGVQVFQVFGAFLFGTVDKLESTLERMQREPDVLILGMRRVMAMDATGLNALEELHAKLRHRGKWLLLSGAHTQPLIMMQKDGFVERLGAENLCEHLDAALARARELLPAGEAERRSEPRG